LSRIILNSSDSIICCLKFIYNNLYLRQSSFYSLIASCSDFIASSPDAIVSRADVIASSSDSIVSRADIIASSPDAIVSRADAISWLPGIIATVLERILEKGYLFTGIEKAGKREL